MSRRHIVALGGGGFSANLDDRALDDYILSLAGRSTPRVCFVPTASGDADSYIVRFYQAFSGSRAHPSHLALFARRVTNLREFILDQDVVYVGGGNTANMLAIWRMHGLDVILREAWEAGIVLCGTSAGAICWFDAGVTDSFGPQMGRVDALGFMSGSFCPHYDSEPLRRPAYHRMVREGMAGGIAADDGVGVHFIGTSVHRIVTAADDTNAYEVALTDGHVTERSLEVVALPRRRPPRLLVF